jgi:DNA transformation protein
MGFSPEYRKEIEEKLGAVRPIETRAMFGGVGIYSEGRFFALIAEDRFFLKVSELNRADFEARGMKPFVPFGGTKPMGYWELPPGILDQPDELMVWTDKALAVADAARAKRKPK